VAAVSACGLAPGDGTVVFGLAAPLTRSYGENSKLGAELAAEEINAAGGMDGITIAIRAQDDGGQAAAAIRVASRFVAEPAVVAVVGHADSDPMMAASKVYHDGELSRRGHERHQHRDRRGRPLDLSHRLQRQRQRRGHRPRGPAVRAARGHSVRQR
jgi:hypothetical protein